MYECMSSCTIERVEVMMNAPRYKNEDFQFCISTAGNTPRRKVCKGVV